MANIKMYRKHFICSFIMFVICMGNVYSQSVVDFGTDLYSTKYYESMNAANPPTGEWYAVDYDDSSWNSYTNPLNFPQYDAFWVRRTFIITDDLANHSFQLKFAHDDGADIYINGHLLHNHNGCCGRYNYVSVPSEYLVKGSNVMAVYVKDTGGSQCLECFISATDGSDIISDLPAEPIIMLSRSEILLYYGVENYSDYTLTPKFITPTGLVDAQITWTSSNQDVVSVTDGYVVAKSAGNAVVTASVTYNGDTYYKECSVEVRAIAEGSKLVIVEEPGTLGSLLTDDEKNNLESLTVFGKLNGEDVHVLRYMTGRDKDGKVTSNKLADLDLCNVEIANGNSITVKIDNSSASVSIQQGAFPNRTFWGCNNLKSVILPVTVTSIGEYAFSDCSSLTSIKIPDGVTSMGRYTFNGCLSLKAIVIPSKVTSIEEGVFQTCSSLASVVIPDGVTGIGHYAFRDCKSLSSPIDIPDGVTFLGNWAFSGCTSLPTVKLPNGINNIGDGLFYNCASLNSVVIPDGVTIIQQSAFYGCSSLASVVIPEGVTSIGSQSFYGCSNLITVLLPSTAINYAWRSFCGCSSLKSINIPEGAKVINDAMFCGCTSLEMVSLPKSLQVIENAAFEGTKSLTSVTITSAITSIKANNANVFDKDALRYLTIEGENMADFEVFQTLLSFFTNTFIIVNEGLYDLYAESEGWEDYSKNIISADMLELKTVEVTANESKSSVFTALGDESLYTANLKIKGSINGYDIMTLRNKTIHLLYLDLSEANIVANDGGYEYYTGCSLKSDNVLGNHSFANLQLREVILPNTLESIENCAFDACRNLEKVVLQEGLISIGKFAFRDCILRNINLPGSLLKIGENAFRNCKLSGTLIIPDQISVIESGAFAYTNIDSLVIGKNVSVIDGGGYRFTEQGNSWYNGEGGAFMRCDNLKGIKFNKELKEIGSYVFRGCSNLTEVNLPYTVEKIDDWAFQDCAGLESIKIPSMTKRIGNGAFGGCNKIRNVYTYTVEPTVINQETFSVYTKATLNVPKTSADLYIYNTQWSQFTKVREFDEPYDAFYLNGDVELNDETGRMSGEPDAEMYETSGFIIEGDDVQELSTIELLHNGKDGASIIGASGSVNAASANLSAKSMNVNISVEGNRWYFFCFPFNVSSDSIECTSDYVFYSYDGIKRAGQGTGWNKLDANFGELQKGLGYIFQASKTGNLTIHVGSEYLSFKAETETEELHTFTSDDPTNASWNFMGNPFISYYDVQDLAAEYDAPIIVWNGRGYDVYKPGDDDYQLKPFEAFFVQKQTGKAQVNFLPDNRITYNKAKEIRLARANQRAVMGTPISVDRQLVNITIMDKDSVIDRTRIVYSTKASMDYEIGVDASKFHADGVPQIYTLNGSARYAINERPMGGDDIKLGYIAPKAGVYTLSVPRQDAEIEIYDNVAQAVVDFTFGDYTFESKAGTFNDRFVIRKTGGVTAVEGGFRLDGLTVTTFDGGLDIEGKMAGKVSVYTESGMLIAEPAQTGRLELGDGAYIVKIGVKSVMIFVD